MADKSVPEALENACYIRLIVGIALLLVFVAVWFGIDFSFAVAPLVVGIFLLITGIQIHLIAAKGNYRVLEGMCTKVIIKRHPTRGKQIRAFLLVTGDGSVYRFHAGSGASGLVENSRLKVYISNDQREYLDGNVKVISSYLALWVD